jgi:DNA-binding MarR family transcriptional regulator
LGQHYSHTGVDFVAIANDVPGDCLPDPGLATLARKIYQLRRTREKMSPVPGLFQDPAWDILLDLYLAKAQGKCISVKSASLACPVPATTALRWLWALEKANLVDRVPDKLDKRRSYVNLSAKGQAYMNDVLGTFRQELCVSAIAS